MNEAGEAVLCWSVVRGESPQARAIEPGPAGIDIPPEILEWAEEHGVGAHDPDVYLLVAPEDEAGEVAGEIAYMLAPAPAGVVAKAREALG